MVFVGFSERTCDSLLDSLKAFILEASIFWNFSNIIQHGLLKYSQCRTSLLGFRYFRSFHFLKRATPTDRPNLISQALSDEQEMNRQLSTIASLSGKGGIPAPFVAFSRSSDDFERPCQSIIDGDGRR